MKKLWKIILLSIVVLFLVIQLPFFTPEKNYTTMEQKNDITTVYTSLNNKDMGIYMKFYNSCYPCHSNTTENYPWYYHVQPVSWWMNKHIVEGKKHLNFSKFSTYSNKKAAHKFEEIAEELRKHAMPLPSYLWTHDEAQLTESQITSLASWAEKQQDSLEQLIN